MSYQADSEERERLKYERTIQMAIEIMSEDLWLPKYEDGSLTLPPPDPGDRVK